MTSHAASSRNLTSSRSMRRDPSATMDLHRNQSSAHMMSTTASPIQRQDSMMQRSDVPGSKQDDRERMHSVHGASSRNLTSSRSMRRDPSAAMDLHRNQSSAHMMSTTASPIQKQDSMMQRSDVPGSKQDDRERIHSVHGASSRNLTSSQSMRRDPSAAMDLHRNQSSTHMMNTTPARKATEDPTTTTNMASPDSVAQNSSFYTPPSNRTTQLNPNPPLLSNDIEKVLQSIDDTFRVQYYTKVDDSYLRDLILVMAKKICILELEQQKQVEELAAVREELHALKMPLSLENVNHTFLHRDVAVLQQEVQHLQLIQRQMTAGLRTDEGSSSGLTVMGISVGGPADAANIQVGDTITRVNGRIIQTQQDLSRALESASVGRSVEVMYYKNNGEGPKTTYLDITGPAWTANASKQNGMEN